MPALTLHELAAFSDEIAALARAGIPLDQGLRDLGGDLRGRLSRVASDLGERLDQGENLAELVSRRPEVFPPAFAAVVAAGLRAGRLPAALESVARSARTLADLRQTIRAAWIYPIVVLVCAYVLLGMMMKTMPVFWKFLELQEVPLNGWENLLQWLTVRREYWYPALGLAGFSWLVWSGVRSTVADDLFQRGGWNPFRWGTGWRAARAAAQQGAFCELLAALIEHETPLPEAIELASAGVAGAGLEAPLAGLRRELETGSKTALSRSSLPALTAWVLGVPQSPAQLADRLRKLSGFFRREAERRTAWAAIKLPILLTIGVGGSAVALYGAILLVPWIRILVKLMEPAAR